MPINRRELLRASVAGAAMLKQGSNAFAAPPGNIQVAIDAAKSGQPINPMVFGGYMEPATTSVWAEMLSDRKFARPVVSAQPAAAPANAPARFRGRGEPFRPVGPEGTVVMDTVRPFVGKHSPRVKLDGSAPRGIQQSRLRVAKGKALDGRVWLAGSPGAKLWSVWSGDPAPAILNPSRFPLLRACTRNFRSSSRRPPTHPMRAWKSWGLAAAHSISGLLR